MMKDPRKITILSNGDDWEAIYVDGKKTDEGHELRLWEVLGILGFEVESREVSPDDEDAFPETLP